MSLDPSLSTVHLCMRKGVRVLAVGSGAVYERDSQFFIATAWHNLSGFNAETLSALDSIHKATPDNVIVTIATIDGESNKRISFALPLESKEEAMFLVHPQTWPRIDVAVLPIDLDEEVEVIERDREGKENVYFRSMRQHGEHFQPMRPSGLFEKDLNADELLELGDELFVLGYPRGIADRTRAPLWKRATVASDPREGWNGEKKFLIDCASRAGMSGGPVITHAKGSVSVKNILYIPDTAPSTALHGIYVGRILDGQVPREDRLFEAQIGTVWKRQTIDEIIDARHRGLHSSRVGESEKTVREAVQMLNYSNWHQIPGIPELREALIDTVMVHLQGNAAFHLVAEAVDERAEKLRTERA